MNRLDERINFRYLMYWDESNKEYEIYLNHSYFDNSN